MSTGAPHRELWLLMKVVSRAVVFSFDSLAMARALTRLPSHLPNSLYQFLTRDDGQTIITLMIAGLQSGLCRSSVQTSVIH